MNLKVLLLLAAVAGGAYWWYQNANNGQVPGGNAIAGMNGTLSKAEGKVRNLR